MRVRATSGGVILDKDGADPGGQVSSASFARHSRAFQRHGYALGRFCQRARQSVWSVAVGVRYRLPPVGRAADAVYGMRLIGRF